MATILEFRRHQEDDRRKAVQRSPSSAEIIIFPGIRYERWEEPRVASERKVGNVARDVLTLVD